MMTDRQHRMRILQRLRAERKAQGQQPEGGWVTEKDLKDAEGDIGYPMGVLLELGHARKQGYRYRITGAGVLALEEAAREEEQ